MTSNEFIYWLKGFVDNQLLNESENPQFNRIKDELMKVSDYTNSFGTRDINGKTISIPCGTDGVGVLNTGQSGVSTATYKTDVPFTYTTK